jgi:hypothetical protein
VSDTPAGPGKVTPADDGGGHQALLREYGVLAAGPVQGLDELVTVAAAQLDTPYAALSFLDGDRERFALRNRPAAIWSRRGYRRPDCVGSPDRCADR